MSSLATSSTDSISFGDVDHGSAYLSAMPSLHFYKDQWIVIESLERQSLVVSMFRFPSRVIYPPHFRVIHCPSLTFTPTVIVGRPSTSDEANALTRKRDMTDHGITITCMFSAKSWGLQVGLVRDRITREHAKAVSKREPQTRLFLP